MRLTRTQLTFLRITRDLGGTSRVFPDQWSTATALEARGLLTGNGKFLDRETTLTAAGRAALQAQGDER